MIDLIHIFCKLIIYDLVVIEPMNMIIYLHLYAKTSIRHEIDLLQLPLLLPQHVDRLIWISRAGSPTIDKKCNAMDFPWKEYDVERGSMDNIGKRIKCNIARENG